ncbi:hypothetical protein HUJ05_001802 [Dendroctonus ponderosae]|nr:hypothetical protein HUJ05_001802 [Dendroctonus ponderosae]
MTMLPVVPEVHATYPEAVATRVVALQAVCGLCHELVRGDGFRSRSVGFIPRLEVRHLRTQPMCRSTCKGFNRAPLATLIKLDAANITNPSRRTKNQETKMGALSDNLSGRQLRAGAEVFVRNEDEPPEGKREETEQHARTRSGPSRVTERRAIKYQNLRSQVAEIAENSPPNPPIDLRIRQLTSESAIFCWVVDLPAARTSVWGHRPPPGS